MKTSFGFLFALTLVLGAATAEANYTIAGAFTGTVDYLYGARNFFQTSNARDVDRVVGSVQLYATTALPGTNSNEVYRGTADYSLDLLNDLGQTLLRYSGKGSAAYFDVRASKFGFTTTTDAKLSGDYQPVSFSASFSAMALEGFDLVFQNPISGNSGAISGNFLTSTVTVTPNAEPPLPTPLPASLPLFGSGLACLGFLWSRKLTQR